MSVGAGSAGSAAAVLTALCLALPVAVGMPGGEAAVNGGGSTDGAEVGTAHAVDWYVVDDDGSAEYRSVNAALDDASDGDVVVVEPGTYREAIRVADDVTLRAPDGATLSGATLGPSSVGITIVGDATPEIRGFVVAGYGRGVDAVETGGAWVLEDVTVRNCTRSGGVVATASSGAWTVSGVEVRNCRVGVVADDSTGDWTVAATTVANVSADGLSATGATGNWTIRETVVRRARYDGIDAGDADGAWTVRDVRVHDVTLDGVDARNTDGAWTVAGTELANYTTGVDARYATGDWTVRDSVVREGSVGIDARDTTGAWTLANTSVRDSDSVGVAAGFSAGDWTLRNATVVESGGFGISAHRSAGDWRILDSRVGETAADGIEATGTDGEWAVHGTSVVATALHGPYANEEGEIVYVPGAINATGADPAGNATGNWWGTAAGAGEDCIGNVDCGAWLRSPPGDPSSGPANRTVDADSVISGGRVAVTLRVEFAASHDAVSIQDRFRGPIRDASIRRIDLDGERIPEEHVLFSNADEGGVSVALRDLPENATVEVRYAVTVAADAGEGDSVTFAGADGADVAAGDLTAEFGTDTVPVSGDPVAWADENGDGRISTPELNAAIQAWARDEISTAGLQVVIQAWARGG